MEIRMGKNRSIVVSKSLWEGANSYLWSWPELYRIYSIRQKSFYLYCASCFNGVVVLFDRECSIGTRHTKSLCTHFGIACVQNISLDTTIEQVSWFLCHSRPNANNHTNVFGSSLSVKSLKIIKLTLCLSNIGHRNHCQQQIKHYDCLFKSHD